MISKKSYFIIIGVLFNVSDVVDSLMAMLFGNIEHPPERHRDR